MRPTYSSMPWFRMQLTVTLLREARRALHARIAEILEHEFVDISEAQPELLARHCAEAGLIEKGRRPMG